MISGLGNITGLGTIRFGTYLPNGYPVLGGVGTGSLVTISFASTLSSAPYAANSYVLVEGLAPPTVNGISQVVSSNTSAVVISNPTAGPITGAGAVVGVSAPTPPSSNIAVFTIPGVSTWTVPLGVTSVNLLLVGGGGNGATLGTDGGIGGGGSSGEIKTLTSIAVIAGTTYSVTVGNSGGITSFSTYTANAGNTGTTNTLLPAASSNFGLLTLGSGANSPSGYLGAQNSSNFAGGGGAGANGSGGSYSSNATSWISGNGGIGGTWTVGSNTYTLGGGGGGAGTNAAVQVFYQSNANSTASATVTTTTPTNVTGMRVLLVGGGAQGHYVQIISDPWNMGAGGGGGGVTIWPGTANYWPISSNSYTLSVAGAAYNPTYGANALANNTYGGNTYLNLAGASNVIAGGGAGGFAVMPYWGGAFSSYGGNGTIYGGSGGGAELDFGSTAANRASLPNYQLGANALNTSSYAGGNGGQGVITLSPYLFWSGGGGGAGGAGGGNIVNANFNWQYQYFTTNTWVQTSGNLASFGGTRSGPSGGNSVVVVFGGTTYNLAGGGGGYAVQNWTSGQSPNSFSTANYYAGTGGGNIVNGTFARVGGSVDFTATPYTNFPLGSDQARGAAWTGSGGAGYFFFGAVPAVGNTQRIPAGAGGAGFASIIWQYGNITAIGGTGGSNIGGNGNPTGTGGSGANNTGSGGGAGITGGLGGTGFVAISY